MQLENSKNMALYPKLILDALEKVRYPADCNNPAPFSVVKKWFFTRFPNYGRMTAFDEKGHIIDTAA